MDVRRKTNLATREPLSRAYGPKKARGLHGAATSKPNFSSFGGFFTSRPVVFRLSPRCTKGCERESNG